LKSTEGWNGIIEGLRPEMEAMHQTRELALSQCRKLIQTSAKCIRHVHRRQFDEAKALLIEAKAIAKAARVGLDPHGPLLYAGYLQDAEKEMVEAAAVLAIALDEPIPSSAELGVQITSYLNGMGEAASECRRYVLDEMRKGSLEQAERMLSAMETIYEDLITFDYADSLTGGLRRTCDALRAVVERTRSDLTMTHSQQELLGALRQANPLG
jgi:translin